MTRGASSWPPGGGRAAARNFNWKFRISDKVESKNKNVKTAALKGGATEASADLLSWICGMTDAES
jgi:hypothetical protein